MPRIFGPIVKPGVSFSTTKLANVGALAVGRLGAGQQRDAERHVGAGVGDERLAAVDQPAAVVALGAGAGCPRASEPASGSVRPNAPSTRPSASGRSQRSRCSSLPNR